MPAEMESPSGRIRVPEVSAACTSLLSTWCQCCCFGQTHSGCVPCPLGNGAGLGRGKVLLGAPRTGLGVGDAGPAVPVPQIPVGLSCFGWGGDGTCTDLSQR